MMNDVPEVDRSIDSDIPTIINRRGLDIGPGSSTWAPDYVPKFEKDVEMRFVTRDSDGRIKIIDATQFEKLMSDKDEIWLFNRLFLVLPTLVILGIVTYYLIKGYIV